jgi:HlyD family secretion protein
MAAAVEILVDWRADVLRAPDAALRYRPGAADIPPEAGQPGSSRLFVLRDGKPTVVPVELGLGDGAYTEIVKGDLRPGEAAIIGEKEGPFPWSAGPTPHSVQN